MKEKLLRILLVEDDEDDRILTEEYLHDAFGNGFSLDWVRNYSQALNLIEVQRYDIHLVDYRLGEESGLELINEFSIRQICPTPTILLTGQDDRETDLAAMKAGASDYLVKQQLSVPLLERAIRYAIERKKVEIELQNIAHYDPLTSLANRSLFQTRLNDVLAQAKRIGNYFAVFLLDMDNFKEVNDTLGHPAGDALLVEVANRLQKIVRETDTIARLGGDEFAIITNHIQDISRSSILIAQKLVDELSKPYELHNEIVNSSASVGIAIFPHDGCSGDELLKNADLALYKSKDIGRSAYTLYDEELNKIAIANLAIKRDIKTALATREFYMSYQPVVDVQGWHIQGIEALVRWRHPKQGVIPPIDFVPIAEDSGLIVPLGRLILEMVTEQIDKWKKERRFFGRIAVNISPLQLRGRDLVEDIQRIGTDPRLLEFEITENVLIEPEANEIKVLEELYEMGVKITLDDFGTGYSSLSCLRRLPVHKIKIDQSFISEIGSKKSDEEIVRAIFALSKALNLEVVAEGVENPNQFKFLANEQCDLMQGFLIARPVPAGDVICWLPESEEALEA